MRLKIPGGTVSDGQASLCNTCRSATIIRGSRLSDEIIACGKRIISDRTRSRRILHRVFRTGNPSAFARGASADKKGLPPH